MFNKGQQIGRYNINSSLGAGGMGEVYLVEDTKLERLVALKILPSDVASNEERMRRFTQEAKAAAALNHPNIAHIYEIGESDGTHFIAMEFIDGVTLTEKIHREKTQLRKLLKYLTQVAEGLAKAHAAGIVHRDLKPDNIMIARDDYAKILDFGLAKLIEPQRALGSDSTSSEVATAILPQQSVPGMIMGTVGYMSPEQAQGKVKEIDHRSDIFSFGCILYEAATKQKAFEGKDALDSLHKLVHAPTPQIRDVNSDAPQDLQRIIRRCLAKEPGKRYQSIKDAAIELDELRQELKDKAELEYSVQPETTSEEQRVSSSPQAKVDTAQPLTTETAQSEMVHQTSSAEYLVTKIRSHKKGLALALAAFCCIVAAGAFLWYKFANQNQQSASGNNMRITRLISGLKGRPGIVSISPDGKYVAYALWEDNKSSLWVKQVSQDTSLQILSPLEETWFAGTAFSHDGEIVYFVTGSNKTNPLGSLYQVPVLGGKEPKKIIDHIGSPVSLSPDGKQFAFIRFYSETGESAVMIANLDGGGEAKKIGSRKGNDWFWDVSWSPDGKTIACAAMTVTGGYSGTVVAIPDVGGEEKPITDYKWGGIIGRMHWVKDGSGLILVAGEKSNTPPQLWYLSYPDGKVSRITNDLNSYASLGVTSDASTIVTTQEERSAKIWIAAPNEDESRARKISSGKQDGRAGLSLMPDGRIVYVANVNDNYNLWIMNADGTGNKPLMSDTFSVSEPAVSSDGRYIIFQSRRQDNMPHIWRIDADGGNLKQLTTGEDYYARFSPDGHWVVFQSYRTGKVTLWKVPVDGGEAVQISNNFAYNANISPDGKLISCRYMDENVKPARERHALLSFEDGQVVRVFDLPSFAGSPHWSTDGREFIYHDTRNDVGNIWSQPVAGGTPKQLTKFSSDFIDNFAISRDGKRFVISQSTRNNEVVLIKDFR